MKNSKKQELTKLELEKLENKKKENKKKIIKIAKVELILLITSLATVFGMLTTYAIIADKIYESFAVNLLLKYFIVAGVMFITLNVVGVYYLRLDIPERKLFKEISIIVLTIFFVFIISTVTGRGISIYMIPICVIGLLITVLFDSNLAIFVNATCILLFYVMYSIICEEITSYSLIVSALIQLLSTVTIIVITKRSFTRIDYLLKCFVVSIAIGFLLTFITSMFFTSDSINQSLTSAFWAWLSIMLGFAIFMILLPTTEKLFKVYSTFKLDEICSSDSKFMKRLREEAPGTYNHSIAMATLAQECAIKIGENPALARACCLYHDIGKLKSPLSFTENQTGYNPHDDYVPEVSVRLITRHTKDGKSMIEDAGLPDILAQVAQEHHGTQTVGFFLNKTRGFTEDVIDEDSYRYDGPKPSTKMSALVMIVDTVEAATRSMGIDDDEVVFKGKIHNLIMGKMNAGQFTDAPITLKDLQDIEDTLIQTLPKLYHKRIKYN